MNNVLQNKIVFITGASSGIGAACAQQFAKAGAKLLLCARRVERLQSLQENLQQQYGAKIHLFQLDVTKRNEVVEKLSQLPPEWQAIDVLVNNAGLSRGLEKFHQANIDDWEEMIDTNVKGLLYVSRAIVPCMVARGQGQVINIGSVAGHEVYPAGNVYCATKHAVDALTKGLRMDLLGSNIRVSTVDPGLVETEFSVVRFKGDKNRADSVYQNMHPLSPLDVADAVVYCASAPPHVTIAMVQIIPTDQASATLVHRK